MSQAALFGEVRPKGNAPSLAQEPAPAPRVQAKPPAARRLVVSTEQSGGCFTAKETTSEGWRVDAMARAVEEGIAVGVFSVTTSELGGETWWKVHHVDANGSVRW